MVQKIAELQGEASEHELVCGTLEPLEGSRVAYRMVGGVLMERTVTDVLPAVRQNLQGIHQLIQTLTEVCGCDCEFVHLFMYMYMYMCMCMCLCVDFINCFSLILLIVPANATKENEE